MEDELLRINTVLANLRRESAAGGWLDYQIRDFWDISLDKISLDWLRFQRRYHASSVIPFIVRDAIEEQIADVWRRVEASRYN